MAEDSTRVRADLRQATDEAVSHIDELGIKISDLEYHITELERKLADANADNDSLIEEVSRLESETAGG